MKIAPAGQRRSAGPPREPAGKLRAAGVFAAYFFALFLLFTPFEQAGGDHSMLPKFLAAGLALMLSVPLLLLARIRLTVSTVLVFVALLAIVLHTLIIEPAPPQFVLLICANVAVACVLYETSLAWRAQFEAAISCLLLINIVVIAAQAGAFHLLSMPIIDFHKAIFGSDSRFAEDYLNIARFSGLQVEPGTYANCMSCLVAILMLSSRFSKRVLHVTFAAIVSIFLTNSGSAVYFVPVLIVLMGVVWPRSISPLYLALLVGAIVVYLAFSGFVAHLEARFLGQDDGSLSHRIDGVHAWMAISVEEKLRGIGFATDLCTDCFYQDIGVVFNLVTRGGALVTLALGLLAARALRLNGIVLATVVLLIPINEKMYFYDAAIWLLLLFGSSRVRPAGAPQHVLRAAPAG